MASIRRAFTLVELLTVIAIVVVIAAVLFPVFASAKNAGQKAACVSNYKQLALATGLYVSDYEDRYMPVNHQPASEPNSRNDRTWVQLVLPYVRNFSVFRCPSDYSDRPRLEATYDQDLVPGDTYSQFYTASLRSNAAYNYLYLSPIVRSASAWSANPRATTDIAAPSNTILFVDSVWSRNEDGRPVGGGSWLVIPPCRYTQVAGRKVDTFGGPNALSNVGHEVFIPTEAEGWEPTKPQSPLVYGGAWPWHSGQMTVAYTDGSVASINPAQLTLGCDVRDKWEGTIQSVTEYKWDLFE